MGVNRLEGNRMRNLIVGLVLGAGILLVGCEKKQEATASKTGAVTSEVTSKSAATASVEGTEKMGSPSGTTSSVAAAETKTPIKVPDQGVKNDGSGDEEKGDNLSADACKPACTNAVSLSVKAEKNAALKEQLQAFGQDDCQAQCLKKGTKKQVECMTAAKSLKDLANCGI